MGEIGAGASMGRIKFAPGFSWLPPDRPASEFTPALVELWSPAGTGLADKDEPVPLAGVGTADGGGAGGTMTEPLVPANGAAAAGVAGTPAPVKGFAPVATSGGL